MPTLRAFASGGGSCKGAGEGISAETGLASCR